MRDGFSSDFHAIWLGRLYVVCCWDLLEIFQPARTTVSTVVPGRVLEVPHKSRITNPYSVSPRTNPAPRYCLLSFEDLSDNLRTDDSFNGDAIGRMWDVIVAGDKERLDKAEIAESLRVIQEESAKVRHSTHAEVGRERCGRVLEHLERVCAHFGVGDKGVARISAAVVKEESGVGNK